MRASNRLIAIVSVAALAQAALLWFTMVPLGVPGEWTWPRMAMDIDGWAALLTGGLAVTLYSVLVWAGAQRLRRARSFERAGWLAALTAAGCAWLCVVIETTPGPLGLGRAQFVLYYPRTSGYFLQSRAGLEDWPQFLAGYQAKLEEGDVLHLGTHPPGLAMGYGYLLDLCRRHPTLTETLMAIQPESVRRTTGQLQSQALPEFERADAACLWLVSLLTLLSAVATIWPLYGLLTRAVDRETAWQLVALWPLVPALAVFFPKSDLLYPFVAMLFAWLWLTGWERGVVWKCLAATIALLTGLLLSLAFLPVAAIVGLASLVQWRRDLGGMRSGAHPESGPSNRRRAWCLALAATTCAATLVTFRIVCDINLLNVWRLNFVNHAGFYDEFPRTWWKWLFVNPIELALAAGAVLSVLALIGVTRCLKAPPRTPVVLGVVLVWSALWLSGKNMGEAARLWILLMPWLAVVAASGHHQDDDRSSDMAAPAPRWIVLIALQAALCLLTAHRVDGFHFDELLQQAGAVEQTTGDRLPGP